MEQNNSFDKITEVYSMRLEFTKLIEFIKNKMLQFLYYSSILQAGILVYYDLSSNNDISPKSVYLVLASVILASINQYFLIRYHVDYKFAQYRYDTYLDTKVSTDVRMSLNLPFYKFYKGEYKEGLVYCNQTFADNIYKECMNIFRGEPFQICYLGVNWGINLAIIYFFVLLENNAYYFMFFSLTLLATIIIYFVQRKRAKNFIRNHNIYVSLLSEPVDNDKELKEKLRDIFGS